ncbi:hypothetical protein HN51_035641 [Arachis hypogaea]|nr:uncharacterized protein DS421_13g409500 [Arachis hypogaea]
MVKLTFTNMFLVALLLLALTSETVVSQREEKGKWCLYSWMEIGCKDDVCDTKCKNAHGQTAKGHCSSTHCVCSYLCDT